MWLHLDTITTLETPYAVYIRKGILKSKPWLHRLPSGIVAIRYIGYMGNPHMLFIEEKEYIKVKHGYIGYSWLLRGCAGYDGHVRNFHMLYIQEKKT